MHPNSIPRRRHSDEFKAKVLAACDAPGASISGVALAHGLNTNLVRKWRSGVNRCEPAITPTAAGMAQPALGAAAEFVAIEMPAAAKRDERKAAAADPGNTGVGAQALIQIELRRGPLQLSVSWPSSAAHDCTAWLRELSASLLK